MATPINAGTSYFTFDGRGRLTQRCAALSSGEGELATYQLDHADNRSNYTNARTDVALYANQAIYSPSGNTELVMQGDSNFVLYRNTGSGWSPTWWTNTVGTGASVAYFQSDGNLVLYTPQGMPVWWTGTQSPCAGIAVTDGGKVTITNTSGAVIWSAP